MPSLEEIIMAKRTQNQRRRILVTAALPYINNVPHLGHIAGSHLPADIFARFCRSKGYETLFVGGTDEHGSASEIAAKAIGQDLAKFSEVFHGIHKGIYDWFDISYDNFSRTTRPIHHQTVREFFETVHKKGYISEGKMKVLYSPDEQMFLPDRYVVGECPKCGYPSASGDQCEKCTSVLDSTELKNPRSALTGSKLEVKETKHLFFDLEKISPKLKEWVNHQTQWRVPVRNLALGWIAEGLKKRCITRDLKNGIAVPLKGFENKVFYVWFDAPIGYVSSTREVRPDDWETFWKDSRTEIHNFLGKDNIPFHTIFWPGMILANGEYNLPKNVVGLQYLNYEGQKFSKSKGIGVFCEKLPELGVSSDIWRSYLAHVIPETNDSEFRWTDFRDRVNADLIDNYGNLVNRVVKFIEARLGSKVKQPSGKDITPRDKQLFDRVEKLTAEIEDSLEKAEIRRAYAGILELSSEGNKYIHDTKAWKALKDDPQRANDIFYNSARLLRGLAIVSAPYLPKTASAVWGQLNLPGSPSDPGIWDSATADLGPEHTVGKAQILFKKITDADVESYKSRTSKAVNTADFFK